MVRSNNKISLPSVRVRNMNCPEYVALHNRMYSFCGNSAYYVCLVSSVSESVMIPVTDVAFNEFVHYEMKFSDMLNLFAALCMKNVKVPF